MNPSSSNYVTKHHLVVAGAANTNLTPIKLFAGTKFHTTSPSPKSLPIPVFATTTTVNRLGFNPSACAVGNLPVSNISPSDQGKQSCVVPTLKVPPIESPVKPKKEDPNKWSSPRKQQNRNKSPVDAFLPQKIQILKREDPQPSPCKNTQPLKFEDHQSLNSKPLSIKQQVPIEKGSSRGMVEKSLSPRRLYSSRQRFTLNESLSTSTGRNKRNSNPAKPIAIPKLKSNHDIFYTTEASALDPSNCNINGPASESFSELNHLDLLSSSLKQILRMKDPTARA